MLIPHAERAQVDIHKLFYYCLNPKHDEGKHKARLFAAALGMTAEAAPELCRALLTMIKTHNAELGLEDKYGQRYTVDFIMEWGGQEALIRSGWIVEHGSDIPRLTTCYPL